MIDLKLVLRVSVSILEAYFEILKPDEEFSYKSKGLNKAYWVTL